MKNIINDINKIFENKTRLGIMAALSVNSSLDFKSLKELLGITDGNLSSNISTLEKVEFVIVSKTIVNKKTNTTYKITDQGREAFQKHLAALEKLIKDCNK